MSHDTAIQMIRRSIDHHKINVKEGLFYSLEKQKNEFFSLIGNYWLTILNLFRSKMIVAFSDKILTQKYNLRSSESY